MKIQIMHRFESKVLFECEADSLKIAVEMAVKQKIVLAGAYLAGANLSGAKTYWDNCRKLDVCKVWGVQVSDCWFDNQTMPNVKPIHWTAEDIKDFRHRCRKHNQLVTFGYDPELKATQVNDMDILF